MSEKDISFIKKWFLGVSGVLITQTLALVFIGISDHFKVVELQKEMAVVYPRTEEMWWAHKSSSKTALKVEKGFK